MTGSILSNERILPNVSLYEMRLKSEVSALPGQFIMLRCGEDTTLRRPISVAASDGETLTVCYDVRGRGTKWLSERKAGENADFLAPVGRGFTLMSGKRALLVGGGIGIYPLLPLAGFYGEASLALFGFRNAGAVNYTDKFAGLGCAVKTITDDRGFVTELLRGELEAGGFDIIYACGPRPMMKATVAMALEFGVECEVSMEERMACGVGACHGCVCETVLRENGVPSGKAYKRVCVDGPVFDARDICW